MADSETEKWATKSKQIEAERQKAIKDLENTQSGKANLAFLDPKSTKVKGWSRDPDVILANTERMSDRALIFAIAGVILNLIGYVGGEVSSLNDLGMGALIISGIPSSIGYACLGIAVLLGLIVIVRELYIKTRRHQKLTPSFWTSLCAVAVVAVYFIVLIAIGAINIK